LSVNGTSEGFWDFSVRTYRTEGVPEACLSLQNDYGADVNMLLYCGWVGGFYGRFDDALFSKASSFADKWADEVVRPLRSARTWMKQSGCFEEPMSTEECMGFREEIKSVEFAAEKMQQQVLETIISGRQFRADATAAALDDVLANLQRYADHTGIVIGDDVREKFSVIIRAAFPDWPSI
jgi:uncharacterized protein (TIGR02444 family)